jgi:hypothetical protein
MQADLGESGHVRGDAKLLLSTARGVPETRDHLIKQQQHTTLLCELSQSLQEPCPTVMKINKKGDTEPAVVGLAEDPPPAGSRITAATSSC